MFPAEAVGFGFLLLLQLSLLSLLLFLYLSGFVYSCLFGGDDFVLDVFVVVGSPTGGAQAVHVVLDIVVAELAYLHHMISHVAQNRGVGRGGSNLVSARTGLEALVGEVELLHTERAGLLLVIVEYEGVLLYAFGHGDCEMRRAVGRRRVEIATGGEVWREAARAGGGCDVLRMKRGKKSRNAGR